MRTLQLQHNLESFLDLFGEHRWLRLEQLARQNCQCLVVDALYHAPWCAQHSVHPEPTLQQQRYQAAGNPSHRMSALGEWR